MPPTRPEDTVDPAGTGDAATSQQGLDPVALRSHYALAAREADIGYWMQTEGRPTVWNDQLRALYGVGAADPLPQSPAEWIDGYVYAGCAAPASSRRRCH